MFSILKRKKPDHANALTRQTIGGQSVVYRLFRQTLDIDDSSLRKLELTYFAASVTTFVYLHFSKNPNKERELDEFAQSFLRKSIASAGEQISLNAAITQYQSRYGEYRALIAAMFDPRDKPSPEVTLLLHLFESVTGMSAKGHMIQLASVGGTVNQYIADHVDFVRTKL